MDDECIDSLMTAVLDKYSLLLHESTDITNILQNLKFVKVAPFERKCPMELFDPNNECIKNIFQKKKVFPVSPYSASNYIKILKDCGLRTFIDPQEILDIIYSISLPFSCDPQRVDDGKLCQSKAVLQTMASSEFVAKISGTYEINPEIESSSISFVDALMKISKHRSWLPVLAEKPEYYPPCLSWKGDSSTSHFISLCDSACVTSSRSSFLPLVYGSQVYFTEPCSQLKTEKPAIKHLIPHFKHVIGCKHLIQPDVMMKIVCKIYTAMQEYTNLSVELKTLKEWVYIKKHHKFVGVDSVALQYNPGFHCDIEPYLYKLPESISDYTDLFLLSGMTDTISYSQIVSMLALIKKSIDTNNIPQSVTPDIAWKTVLYILNWLTDSGKKEIESELPVFVPAKSDSKWPDLKEPSQLVYADNDYLKNLTYKDDGCLKKFTESISTTLTLVHRDIETVWPNVSVSFLLVRNWAYLTYMKMQVKMKRLLTG